MASEKPISKYSKSVEDLKTLFPDKEAYLKFEKQINAIEQWIGRSDSKWNDESPLLVEPCDISPFSGIVEMIKSFEHQVVDGKLPRAVPEDCLDQEDMDNDIGDDDSQEEESEEDVD